MSLVLGIIIILPLTYGGAKTAAANNTTDAYKFCQPKHCSNKGPEIRFPFRLKTQPISCGLEGFELSCSNNKTVLNLPVSGDYYVKEISYLDNTITIMKENETICHFFSLPTFSLAKSMFFFSAHGDYTILNCTEKNILDSVGPIGCNGDEQNFVYLFDAYNWMDSLPSSCISWVQNVTISFEMVDAIARGLTTPTMVIEWQDVNGCHQCEKSGNYCGFNVTSNSTICIELTSNSTISIEQKHGLGPLSLSLLSIGASIGGTILFALVIFIIYQSRKSEKDREVQIKVEKFLDDYRTINPTRYTFRELKKITGNFKHRLGQGGYGSVFRGKLLNGIPVAVKMLEHLKGNGQEFINEVATIGRIHHFNIVRLLGFCSEGSRRALIYEFMPNGSLEKFVFSKMNNSTHRPLSWEKLRKIAIGVARGIEYLHQGCNQRILHFDIKPHNILLDHNFQPKISDFGLAKLCLKEQSIVSLTAARGTAGYIAPELFSRNFGDISYKSDVYSYGMMLLEMVGCRKNIDPEVENQSQIYFPEWIYNKMIQGEGLCLEFEEYGDEGIAKRLATVALWCIQWNPTERPSMPMAIQMLEGDLQSLEMPPMPFVSSDVEMDTIH